VLSLAVCHWPAQRLSGGVTATAEAFRRLRHHPPTGADVDLATVAAAVPEALPGVLDDLTIDTADSGTFSRAAA
jgi:hypothetical protein